MQIINKAIAHRTTVFVLILLIVVMGLRSYLSLPRESAPDITIPRILVTTYYEGAAPSEMESLITKPLERKLKALKDAKEMISRSEEGLSVIDIEFQPESDIDFSLQRVKDKVDLARPDLPGDLEDDPMVTEISFSDFPIMNVIVAGDIGLEKLKDIAEDLSDDIETVKGVLKAEIIGGRETEILVEIDPERLFGYGLAVNELIAAIQNNNVTMPSGTLDMAEGRYSLKVPGEFEQPREIGRLVVATRDGHPIYLQDIGTVRRTFEDRKSFARYNGEECVTLLVTKRSGENLLRIADEIKNYIDVYRQRYPDAVQLSITNDGSEDIEMMVSDLENNILSGMLLVLCVIFFSLGLRNAVLVASVIPLSMLISFSVLQVLGVTLNMVVLFSLVLALGMLVDNAIVVVENITRHHGMGKTLVQAARDGADEIAWPIISSTATTVAAFAPMLLWPGIMGEFMQYLPLTVIIVLSSSLFVAIVISPTLSSLFVRSRQHTGEDEDWTRAYGPLMRPMLLTYRTLLTTSLKARPLVALVFILALIGSIQWYAATGLGVEFFPDTEPRIIEVKLEAPEGANVFHTNALTKQAEAVVQQYGNVESYATNVGGEGGQISTSTIYVDLVDKEDRRNEGPDERIYIADSNDMMTHLRNALQDTIVGAEIKVEKPQEGPPRGKPVNIEISGEDFAVLSSLAETLRRNIAHIPGMVGLEDDYVTGLPEFRIAVDKERAALFGLNTFLVGQMIKASVGGLKVGDFREGEDEYDIVARLPEEQRKTIEDVIRLKVPDNQGNPVPLSSVAEVQLTSGLGAIKRIDQKRVVTVSADLAKGYNAPKILAQIKPIAEQLPLPPGYRISYTGESEEMDESQEFLSGAFLLAVFLISLILVTQFNSITKPVIIVTSVLLSFIGVFLSLIFSGHPFGIIMTGMGVISLAGVVVNNAIVLIDYIDQLYDEYHDMHRAVIEASCVRFRPVILTAITTILGLVPMALGISFDFRELTWIFESESSQWWGPMATAVIYGLAVATLLTLILVPNLISMSHDYKQAVARAWRRWRTPRNARSTKPAGVS